MCHDQATQAVECESPVVAREERNTYSYMLKHGVGTGSPRKDRQHPGGRGKMRLLDLAMKLETRVAREPTHTVAQSARKREYKTSESPSRRHRDSYMDCQMVQHASTSLPMRTLPGCLSARTGSSSAGALRHRGSARRSTDGHCCCARTTDFAAASSSTSGTSGGGSGSGAACTASSRRIRSTPSTPSAVGAARPMRS